jgi:hypothetical protein
MKTMIQCLIVLAMLLVVSVPVFAASEYEVVQIWACEMDDGTTEAQVEAIAAQYLKAVRTMDGGANATARVFFPAVVNNTGLTDFYFVLNAKTFTDWGKIWDANVEGTAMAAADDASAGKVVCPDSMLWEAHVIEPAP